MAAAAPPPAAAVSPARVERELAQFARHAGAARIGRGRIECLEPHAFVIHPDGAAPAAGIDLLLMALVHGDEVGGLLVLNTVCALLDGGMATPSISVGMVACNVAAARRGLRQVERDLNRSFGRGSLATAEDRRARELEPVMRRARYCVDLHQTIEPSHTPFFVFDYAPACLRFAHGILPDVPVVTHWGRPFTTASDGGCTTAEFLHRHGGVGVGIELGQKGDAIDQVATGAALCLRAMAVVADAGEGGAALPALSDGLNPLYTWGEVVPYPDAQVSLVPGLANFQPIEAGQVLGTQDGGPLRAASGGHLLFPKYVRSAQEPKPPELYRLLRRTHLGELGRGDCMRAPPTRGT